MKKFLYILMAIAVLARLIPEEPQAEQAAATSQREEWIADKTLDLQIVARSNRYKDSDRYELLTPSVTDLGDELYIVARYKDTKTGKAVGYRGHYDATTGKRLSVVDIAVN